MRGRGISYCSRSRNAGRFSRPVRSCASPVLVLETTQGRGERSDRRRGRSGVRVLRRAATRRFGPDAEAVAARRRVVAGARRRAGGAVIRRIDRAVPRSVRRARQGHWLERELADHAGGGSGHQGGGGRGRWWDRAHGLGVARLRPVRSGGRRRDGLLRDRHLRRLHGGDGNRGVWAVPRFVLRQRSCRHDADSGGSRDCRHRDRALDALRRRAGREVPASAGGAVERTRGGQVATNCHGAALDSRRAAGGDRPGEATRPVSPGRAGRVGIRYRRALGGVSRLRPLASRCGAGDELLRGIARERAASSRGNRRSGGRG